MNRLLFATALASAGFASTFLAGPLMAQGPDGPAAREQTRAEALALADRRFDRLDADRDGKLTPDEWAASRGPGAGGPPPPSPADGAAPPPPPNGMPGRFGQRMFARLDANGDGFISRDEYRAWASEHFDRLDTNHDSKIDAAEREAARGMMMGSPGGRPGPGGAADGDAMPPPPPSGTPSGQ